MNKTQTAKRMSFLDRAAFRSWLETHGRDHEGIWLMGYKDKKVISISYAEALEEALCFGWIDGIVKSIDEKTYMRYFAPRKPESYFSEKNRRTIEKLASAGAIAPEGWAAIAKAKERGHYDVDTGAKATDENYETLLGLLTDEEAKSFFIGLSNSSKKAYLGLYFSAKTEATRKRRLERIAARLIEKMPLPL
ncbi:MAG: YdeI/OmpD-associated family protein [Bacilli bacterium]